jgi:hypothetical protein
VIDMMFSAAKVQGGKKFQQVHPLVQEARQMRANQQRIDAFAEQAETGHKPNPLAMLPGAKRPKHYVPGVTKPEG